MNVLRFLVHVLLAAGGFMAHPAMAGDKVPVMVHVAGSVLRFEAEVADTAEERSRGLMFRESLATNEGMLFLYPAARPVSFWMKNTSLPLDMLFIDANGRIVNVAAMARPFDETPISSVLPAAAVLEIPGGSAAQLGIRAGDRVEWPAQPELPEP